MPAIRTWLVASGLSGGNHRLSEQRTANVCVSVSFQSAVISIAFPVVVCAEYFGLLQDLCVIKMIRPQMKLQADPLLVRCKGLEPLTYWFVASHSIQLS